MWSTGAAFDPGLRASPRQPTLLLIRSFCLCFLLCCFFSLILTRRCFQENNFQVSVFFWYWILCEWYFRNFFRHDKSIEIFFLSKLHSTSLIHVAQNNLPLTCLGQLVHFFQTRTGSNRLGLHTQNKGAFQYNWKSCNSSCPATCSV